jgi:hypothetical protein
VSRISYVWILLLVGLALLVHACDERQDRMLVREATKEGLYFGIRDGCERDLALRYSLLSVQRELHPDRAFGNGIHWIDCDGLARERVRIFLLNSQR